MSDPYTLAEEFSTEQLQWKVYDLLCEALNYSQAFVMKEGGDVNDDPRMALFEDIYSICDGMTGLSTHRYAGYEGFKGTPESRPKDYIA